MLEKLEEMKTILAGMNIAFGFENYSVLVELRRDLYTAFKSFLRDHNVEHFEKGEGFQVFLTEENQDHIPEIIDTLCQAEYALDRIPELCRERMKKL